MKRTVYGHDHEDFRTMIREFIAKEVVPHYPGWEEQGTVPRELFRQLGALGVTGFGIPEEYGGPGDIGYKYQAIISEEAARACVMLGHYALSTGMVLPYLLALATADQRRRWFPGIISGDITLCIAMTEPGTGSDLAGGPHHRQAGRGRHPLRLERGQDVHLRRPQLRAVRGRRPHGSAGSGGPARPARIKLHATETAGQVVDKCLQLHGGYGYILEYPIARLYADVRVNRIYGGSSEVMKSIIAKDLGL